MRKPSTRVTIPSRAFAFSFLRVQSIRQKQWRGSQDYFSFKSEYKYTANQCHSEKTTGDRGFERTSSELLWEREARAAPCLPSSPVAHSALASTTGGMGLSMSVLWVQLRGRP